MVSLRWTFDAGSNRYRNTDNGRYLAKSAVVKIRDDVVAGAAKEARALAARVANGEISPGDFGAEMRKLIKTVHIAQYELAHGGVNAMTASDRGKLGNALRVEYKALDGFVREIQAGDLAAEDAEGRAEMYIDSSTGSFERGQEAARGVELPPEYPPLHPRCRCYLDWRKEDGAQVAYWTLAVDPCPACVAIAPRYQPWRPAT